MLKHEARYYEKMNGKVHCFLCPHNCKIKEGDYGICRVRKNVGGHLEAMVYGQLIARHSDPIEKKPLYHFYPGKRILSIGTVGCNLKCFFCQNCDISQSSPDKYGHIKETKPDSLVSVALSEHNNIGLAYTYNEPTINFEFMVDTATRVKEQGLKNVMVSNGFISREPLRELTGLIDAFNIDLKAFSDYFYRKHTKSSLKEVKESLVEIGKSTSHLEITLLVIPGLNDSEEEFLDMVNWIHDNFGANQVFHLSRYFPQYKSDIPPTPTSKLRSFREIASEKLNYVFLGNVAEPDGQNSYCPGCGELVIDRNRYSGVEVMLNSQGECKNCYAKILNYN